MPSKIHLRATTDNRTVCATRSVGDGKMRFNGRRSYTSIPETCVVGADDFRSASAEDRCSHCGDLFLSTMNRRRALSGKPLYSDPFTKKLAQD